jgi:hypothetical protein
VEVGGSVSRLSYDAPSATYTITYSPGPQDGSLTKRDISYGPTDSASATNGAFDTYQKTDSADPSYSDRLEITKLGRPVSGLTLTYTQYGIHTVGDGIHFQQQDYFVFGSTTFDVPTAGSADYTGVIDGTYNKSELGQTYRMAGTATLHADFSNSTVATNLTFAGKNVIPSGPDLPQQVFNGDGFITSTISNGLPQFGGTFSGMNLAGGGYFSGSFYGENAEEFGMSFYYSGAADTFSGIAVGKK